MANPKPEPPVYQQLVKRQQAEAIQQTLAQEKELSELKLRFFSMVSCYVYNLHNQGGQDAHPTSILKKY
ncbi:MAG TPA: hypothetical protein VE944_17265 [Nostoc sp.]|uniref:hypothetical protein n=1 Tax=Nostoc sp. TaxID=1180 RepID=UPI002D372C6E|nr:hypothetical protein [Nostoc sp.]HYX16079.1 hypothetical protein [Nostoc sp.]